MPTNPKRPLKTIQARAKQLIRESVPGCRPTQVWLCGFYENEVKRTIGGGGFALSEATMRWLADRGASRIVVAYLVADQELFAEAATIEFERLEFLINPDDGLEANLDRITGIAR